MEERQFKNLKKQWFYVIRTDDGDRYLWEVYAKNELVLVTWDREEAYVKLLELADKHLFK